MKVDLAMYSYTVDVSRQCMSVSLILGCKLDFSSCAIRAGFRKSSHIYYIIKSIALLPLLDTLIDNPVIYCS